MEALTPDDLVAATAARYDGPDDEAARLHEAALQRLAYRKRHGGKRCSKCGHVRTVREYGPDGRRSDGLRSACRVCEARARLQESTPAAYPEIPGEGAASA